MTTWPAAASIEDLARAYHCPPPVMAYIARHQPDLLETICEFGPMRIYWCAEWGWKLNGRPVWVMRNKAGQIEWRPTESNVNGQHPYRWRHGNVNM